MSGHLLVQKIAEEVDREKLQIVTFHPGQILSEKARSAGLDENSFPFDDGMCLKIHCTTCVFCVVERDVVCYMVSSESLIRIVVLTKSYRESSWALGTLGVDVSSHLPPRPFRLGSVGC